MLIVDQLFKCFLDQAKNNESEISNTGSVKANIVVNKVSFKLNSNEIFAVLGENGSGKSTLLKLIAGLIQPDSGTITLNNETIEGPNFKLVAGNEHIKLIHQNYNLLPNKSVQENIMYSMRFLSKEYQQHKLDELLLLCNLQKIAKMLPRQISGGEQQRTAIAAAISTPTELLLLDEPFSNLDVFNKEALKIHLSDIAKTTSILYVTHEAQEALSVAHRIGIFRNGEFLQINTPHEIYNSPVDEYAARISGFVNILDTCLLSKDLKDNRFGIRPENIHFGDAASFDLIGYVKAISFLGVNYLLRVIVKDIYEVIMYSSYSGHTINDSIYMRFDDEKIIYW